MSNHIDINQVLSMISTAAADGNVEVVKYLATMLPSPTKQCAADAAVERRDEVKDEPMENHSPGLAYEAQMKYYYRLRALGVVVVRDEGKPKRVLSKNTAWILNKFGVWKRVLKESDTFANYVNNGGLYFPGNDPRPVKYTVYSNRAMEK